MDTRPNWPLVGSDNDSDFDIEDDVDSVHLMAQMRAERMAQVKAQQCCQVIFSEFNLS